MAQTAGQIPAAADVPRGTSGHREERRKRRKEEFEKIRFKSKKRPAAAGEEGKENGMQEQQELDDPLPHNNSTSSKKTINLLGGFTSVTVENEQHKKDAAVAKEAKRAKKSKSASKNRICAEDKNRNSKKNKRSITARSRGNYVDDGALQEIDVQIDASNVKKQKQNRSASQEEKSKQGLDEQPEQVIVQGSVWCFPKVVTTSHRNYNLDKRRSRNMRPVKKVVYAECTGQERENLKKNDPDAFRRVKSGVGATVANSALGEVEVVRGIDELEQTSSPRPVSDLSDKTFIIMKPKNKNPVATTFSNPLQTHGEQQDKDCKVQ